jgi:hypothetical protein
MKIAVENKSKLYIALITTLISLIILVTGTYAWFTLSLSGKVQEMELKVTAGDSLYVDTVNHGNDVAAFAGKNTVNNDDVLTQLRGNSWFSNSATFGAFQITPLTSGNGTKFYTESGGTITAGALQFMQFDLYFISTNSMDVYLTTAESSTGADDGTKVTYKTGGVNNTSQQAIEKCVRISFSVEDAATAKTYEPKKESSSTTLHVAAAKSDNGGNATQTTFETANINTEGANLFHLDAATAKKVTVRIWIEGEDEQCKDGVIGAVFLTQLRFEGKK